MDDVLLNKAAVIERALKRVDSQYLGFEGSLDTDFDRQDIIVLNLQRACEASIDSAMHIVRVRKLGLPKDKANAFHLLFEAGLVEKALSQSLMKMVGFRNVIVHAYTDIEMEALRRVLSYGVNDLRAWARLLISLA
ncbi:type VII toxin-antitoxin system HepT family RNase toxin [Pseudomaricurvus sp.]|uniref:type VII toxin-antitoxin system HepT family RNase toxin n=1 Tax=Pseudomaricurvus sp. TaxID=2004510 RepID=UPI003F6C8D1A